MRSLKMNAISDKLRNIVLISNSMPKSGSTFLCSLQRELFRAVIGRDLDYSDLTKRGIAEGQGFVSAKNMPRFIEYLESGVQAGPWVIKTHALMTGKFANHYLNCDTTFVSLAIRDPIEIFASARRNFLKTGEFKQFENLESGVNTINNFFSQIYETTCVVSSKKKVPIVHYELLKQDPLGALQQSLHPNLCSILLGSLVKQRVSLDEASNKARHRLSTPKEHASDLGISLSDVKQIQELLAPLADKIYRERKTDLQSLFTEQPPAKAGGFAPGTGN